MRELYEDMEAAVASRDVRLAKTVMSAVAEDVLSSLRLAVLELTDGAPEGQTFDASEVWGIAATVEDYVVNHYGEE